MRPMLALTAAVAIAIAPPALAAPDFAPQPRQVFESFIGINPPRADVPVGALWIDGYGPTGEPAAADNIETVRSLNGLTIDKSLQLSLSFALFELLGIDPKSRGHYKARFTDLAIVRVKDVTRLPGPKGEPRIIEALKAGTVTISSDSEFGLNGQKLGFQTRVDGSGTGSRTRSYAIEARDMFIAIRVATLKPTRSKERELEIEGNGSSARLDDFRITIASACADASTSCRPSFRIAKPSNPTEDEGPATELGRDDQATVQLPSPISDGEGGLFSSIQLRWIPPCAERDIIGCRKHPRLFAHYQGARVEDLRSVVAKNW